MTQGHDRLIESLYDGLTAEPGWQPFLAELCAALGAQTVEVSTEDFDAGDAFAYGIVGIDRHFRDSYDPRFVGDNPWMAANLSAPGVVRGVLASPHHDPEDLEASDYYRLWLAPQDLRYMAACKLVHDGGRVTMFSTLRNRDAGPFDPTALELIARLRPHLRQATMLAERFDRIALQRDVALAALERQANAVLLVTADGRVVWRNAAAERLLPEEGPLYAGRGDRLVCRSLLGHRRLGRALRVAARPASGHPPAATLSLPRDNAPPLHVTIEPFVQRAGALPVSQHIALVTVAEVGAQPTASETLLRRHLGLSPAESRLAKALAEGERLAGYAERAGIGRETARTLLKRAMRKTGARRQADLVRQVIQLTR
ncbi:MAG: helix-turn-helix transcriptional regulator [Alphaproteobacteria bacterium]